MELPAKLFDMLMHLDVHLGGLIQTYHDWVYAILFVIIFCETGLVVTPFLPGDSLLFTIGAFVGGGALDWTVMPLLVAAALCGDNANYGAGYVVGPRVFKRPKSFFFNPEHLIRAHNFYEKYGRKTIIIARFVPIVRTCAPFVAGVGRMPYSRFISFSVFAAILWVTSVAGLGIMFGKRPEVKENFGLVILAIIVISVMPAVIGFIQEWRKGRKTRKVAGGGV